MAIENNAIAAINGTYFDMKNGRTICFMRINGKNISTNVPQKSDAVHRKYYQYVEIGDFLKIYELGNKLTNTEKTFLLILLAIPKEIKLTNDTYLDTKIINNEINYLNKVYELLKELSYE